VVNIRSLLITLITGFSLLVLFLSWMFLREIYFDNSTEYILDEYNFDKILEEIESASNDNQQLHFNSSGGKVSVALKLAKEIKKRKLSLIISKECLSNCAEILIPSASNVKFFQSPMIGFHGNIQSYSFYVQKLAKNNTSYCKWGYVEKQVSILESAGLNTDFWTEQMLRLKPDITFHYEDKKCPSREYNFKNKLWLPTGKQLRDLWGLKFEGSVCADDFDLCKKKIDYRWKKGTRVVVGDEVYISKGR